MEKKHQIFNIDSSSSSSDQNGDEESLRRRSPEGGRAEEDEEEGGKHYGSAQDRIHSMSFDDFRSLLVHTTTTTNPVDSANIIRSRENASTDVDLARRMRDNKRDSSDQRPPRGRPPGTSIPKQQQPMGEIVEVEGGHIVRSTGRKDRHSKVYTAKGPRDRRVRLSALTAIQFYDVQDRLGFDRPSKAVDWLIKKAKTSIDELNQLPRRSTPNILNQQPKVEDEGNKDQAEQEIELENEASVKGAGAKAADSRAIARERARERAKERTQERSDGVAKAQTYLRPRSQLFSLNPASTSPTVPNYHLKDGPASENLGTGSNAANPQMGMRSNNNISSTSSDSISRTFHLEALQQQPFYQYLFSHTNNQAALHNYSTVTQFDGAAATAPYAAAPANSEAAQNSNQQTNQSLFSSSSASAFQIPSGFCREIVMPEQLHHEFFSSQPQPHRILSAPPVWNSNSIYTDFGNNNTNNIAVSAPNMMRGGGHYNSLILRGTLQSSSSPVRVRSNPPLLHDNASAGQSPQTGDGFSGFRIPARIQGIDHENDDVKPSQVSSNSRF